MALEFVVYMFTLPPSNSLAFSDNICVCMGKGAFNRIRHIKCGLQVVCQEVGSLGRASGI